MAHQQPAQAEGTGAADHANFTRRRRPFLRCGVEQLRSPLSHCPAPESMTTQVPCHAATAVRRAQRHDASRLLPWMMMKQRADQNTAQAMSHEVHGGGIARVEK